MNPDDDDYFYFDIYDGEHDFYFNEEEQDTWNDEQELFDPLVDLEDL